MGQREAEALRDARRDRLGLPRREPAGVRHLDVTRHTRASREHPGPTPFPCDEQYEHTSREQHGGNHRNRARAIEAQRSNGGLRSRRFHTVGNDARDAERRATPGNRIDAAVGPEAPQGGHLQRGRPRRPSNNRIPHDPLPGCRGCKHHGIAERLGDGTRREPAGADAPTRERGHRALESDGVPDRGSTRRDRPAVPGLDQEEQQSDHRLIRRARSANARRSGGPYGTVVCSATRSTPAWSSLRVRSCCNRSAATRIRVRVGA